MGKVEDYEDLDRYEDVFGQLPMLQAYSHIIFTFPMPDGITQDQIIHDLEAAMIKVKTKLPWMAAQVVNVGKRSGSSGIYKLAPCPPPEQHVDVKDVSDAFPPYVEVKELKAPMHMLDSELLTPCSSFPRQFEGTDKDPARVVRLQASFLKGGVFLDFVTHHNFTDAGGHFWFLRLIAMAMRGEEFSESFLEQANRDRRNLFPLLGSDEPMLDHSHLKRPPITESTPIVRPDPAKWHFFHISAENMAGLKDLASQPDGFDPSVPFISTDDAISAFCWQRFSTVRLRRLPTADVMARFSRAIDARKVLNISTDYMGDVIHNVVTWISVKDLTEAPLSTIASHMRKRLNDTNNTYHARSFATFIAREPDKSTIAYGGRINPDLDIGSSSVRGAHVYEVFGKLGRPDFVRRPNLRGLSFPGLLTLLPQTPDGGCDFIAGLLDRDLEVLLEDPEWKKYMEYIG